MKRLLLIVIVSLSCGVATAVWAVDAEELRRLREELRQTQEQLRELSGQIERLSRDHPDPLLSPQAFSFATSERPMVGIIMNETADRRGVRLAGVTPDGPAEKAGLRSGDRILAIDGHPLDGRDAVDRAYRLLEDMKAGTTFEFEYERDGERRSASVTAELHQPSWGYAYRYGLPNYRLGDDFDFGFGQGLALDLEKFKQYADQHRDWQWDLGKLPGGAYLWRFGFAWSGLELARMNADLARYFGTAEGVLVIESDLADVDLEGGDVIVAIDGERVDDPKQAMRLLSRYRDGEQIPLRVIRDRAERQVTLVAPRGVMPNVSVYFSDDDENGNRPNQ